VNSLKATGKACPEEAEPEEILGSRGRIRVLKALIKAQRSSQAVSISKLRATTRLRKWNVETHLETLLKWGWIEEIKAFGGRRYMLNAENRKVEALKKLFKDIGYV
jgi:RIO-like serine/threonine protein kinase